MSTPTAHPTWCTTRHLDGDRTCDREVGKVDLDNGAALSAVLYHDEADGEPSEIWLGHHLPTRIDVIQLSANQARAIGTYLLNAADFADNAADPRTSVVRQPHWARSNSASH